MRARIPIRRYVDDESLSWEERYRRLEEHHLEETKFLIKTVEQLEDELWGIRTADFLQRELDRVEPYDPKP